MESVRALDNIGPVKKKAALLLSGPLRVPVGLDLPYRLSCSTAGPGAGSTGIVVAFDGHRVKKAISRERGEYELVRTEVGYSINHGSEVFIEKVEIEPVVFHAPGQAFFNLDNRCIYGCLFCSSSALGAEFEKGHTPKNVVDAIVAAHRRDPFDAVAITSGVPDTPEKTLDRINYVVREVRKALPRVTIGVEPYVTSNRQIDTLYEAGADEIKINIETFDRAIFSKVCPKKDYDQVLHSIAHACSVFGRNAVASNIIVGLGESDENVYQAIDRLATIGCVATLRALRTNGYNRSALLEHLGDLPPVSTDRLLGLAGAHKDILELHGLSTAAFRTMCHRCGCCDIVPFVDLR